MLSGEGRVSPPLTYLRAEANDRRFQLAHRPHGLRPAPGYWLPAMHARRGKLAVPRGTVIFLAQTLCSWYRDRNGVLH